MTDLSSAIPQPRRHTQHVQQLMNIMADLVEKGARTGSVTPKDWQPLEELVDTEVFKRTGPLRDTLDWTSYRTMLTEWVNHCEGWRPVLKSLHCDGDVVFTQLEEMIKNGESETPFYSLTRYQFAPNGKIIRIEVYMQSAQQP